jgi:hypothetical protein
MLDAVIRYAANPYLPILSCILDGSPALKARVLATVRRVQQKQINVDQSAFLDRLLDGLFGFLFVMIHLGRIDTVAPTLDSLQHRQFFDLASTTSLRA